MMAVAEEVIRSVPHGFSYPTPVPTNAGADPRVQGNCTPHPRDPQISHNKFAMFNVQLVAQVGRQPQTVRPVTVFVMLTQFEECEPTQRVVTERKHQ